MYVFHKQKRGLPWTNTFAVAERWLNQQENDQLTPDNIDHPNTKWVFVGFSTVYIKVVLDRQPLLGAGPLPDWLCDIAYEHAGPMVALDTFSDNLSPVLHCC